MNRTKPILSIVIPCYNEEQVIAETNNRLLGILGVLIDKSKIDESSALYFIDDGSTDQTWSIISDSSANDHHIKGLRLSRNYGHQHALLAGLNYVTDKCDCAISIDADLQQDESVIEEFIDKYNAGAEIVFGIRKDRVTDGIVKKWTAGIFYKLMEMLGTPLIRNHADFRLVSRRVLDILSTYKENNPFLRGIFADMGLACDYVKFEVKRRALGESKYTMRKMMIFAVHGISSFSVAPLRLIFIIGLLVFGISALMGLYIVTRSIMVGDTVPGWASTTLPIYFIGGVQMLSIGILGEYIGNIYAETKDRPRYIVSERLG